MDKFERMMRERVALMRDMVSNALTAGGYASFEEYKYDAGYRKALDNVIAEMDQTAEDMRK